MPTPICPLGSKLFAGGKVEYEVDLETRTKKVKDLCVDEKPPTNIFYDLFVIHKYVMNVFKSVLAQQEPPKFEEFATENYRAPIGPVDPIGPVQYSYLDGAREFCAFMERRLPTEPELQHLIRAADHFAARYPLDDGGFLWRTYSRDTINYRIGISREHPNGILRSPDVPEEHHGDAFGDTSFFCVSNPR